jgi:beta-lactamase class D
VTDGRRRAVLIIGGLAAVAVIIAGYLVLRPSSDSDVDTKPAAATPTTSAAPSIGKTVDAFLKLLGAGNGAEAAKMTDDPPAAQAAITTFGRNTAPTVIKFVRKTSVEAKPGDTTLKVPVKADWSIGGGSWDYETSLDMVRKDGNWVVKWAPSILHPQVAAGQNLAVLGAVGKSGEAAVVGDDGKPLAVWDATGAKPVDPKSSPLILSTMTRGSSGPGVVDTRHVSLVDAAGKEVGTPLHGDKGSPAASGPIESTLNASISIAAQNAVAKATQPTMLVAIKPSTGGIVAVAQNDAAGSALRALNGGYQPGSTFKVVTAAAGIQQQGLSPDSDVQCPGQGTYSGRTIHNANFEIGPTKLRTAFARSCNTTFAEIASKLPMDALSKAASQFGLNSDYTIPGLTTELGKVESSDSGSRQVENSIGQGTVTASPLGMALVAATVAARKAVTPQLIRDVPTQVGTGYKAPPAAVLDQIRTMMNEVVATGTAKQLKGVKGLAGKTGTAETTNDGAEAHGWFIGIRGDMAFAVLVQDAGSSAAAITVAGAFLGGF